MPQLETLGESLILEYLARGSHSDVFLALKFGPRRFGRPVVIKALPSEYQSNDDFVELFYQEAHVSCRLDHPNCVTVHDARLIDGVPCIVMDLISGQTVADVAQKGFREESLLGLTDSIRIIADAAEGLHHSHRFSDADGSVFRLVHRDVSPQNLMVTYTGMTKVFDFGIAKVKRGDREMTLMNGGKYAYMSPEQCLGEDIDRRSDIFSLGIILYELCTKRRLFRREGKKETIKAVTEDEIAPPSAYNPEVSDELNNIILKALDRDKTRRYDSAKRFGEALQDWLGEPAREGRIPVGEHVCELFSEQKARRERLIRRVSSLDYRQQPGGKEEERTKITLELQGESLNGDEPSESRDRYSRQLWISLAIFFGLLCAGLLVYILLV